MGKDDKIQLLLFEANFESYPNYSFCARVSPLYK